MKKPLAHQIDTTAQAIFAAALRPTWVVNAQTSDYGKDYLVEIGDDNGNLSGTTFYVQLKGQKAPKVNRDGSVSFSITNRHAKYYLDKVTDMPVFLVVVDTTNNCGWWLHVQPALAADQHWRCQKSAPVKLPSENNLADIRRLKRGIQDAIQFMRASHPLSLQDAISAQRDRVRRLDSRFDISVSSGVDGKPQIRLHPHEEVRLSIQLLSKEKSTKAKFTTMLDKGEPVDFKPGELRVTGSKLFEAIEFHGGTIVGKVQLPAVVSLICRDDNGKELGGLVQLHGEFTGGRRELWFNGGLNPPLLSLKLGPVAPNSAGKSSCSFGLAAWNGQPIRNLAYFDQIYDFVKAAAVSTQTDLRCYFNGNVVFSAQAYSSDVERLKPLAEFLEIVSKARHVCERFGINPVWTFTKFDNDAQEETEELYSMYFGGGFKKNAPYIRLTATADNWAKPMSPSKPEHLRIVSLETYEFLGEQFEIGRVEREFTEMIVDLVPGQVSAKELKRLKEGGFTAESIEKSIRLRMTGTENTVMTSRIATPDD